MNGTRFDNDSIITQVKVSVFASPYSLYYSRSTVPSVHGAFLGFPSVCWFCAGEWVWESLLCWLKICILIAGYATRELNYIQSDTEVSTLICFNPANHNLFSTAYWVYKNSRYIYVHIYIYIGANCNNAATTREYNTENHQKPYRRFLQTLEDSTGLFLPRCCYYLFAHLSDSFIHSG